MLYLIWGWYFFAHKLFLKLNENLGTFFSNFSWFFLFFFFLCNCPEVSSSTVLAMTLKGPLTTLLRLTGKKPYLLSLMFFIMIPAKENWPRTGGGGWSQKILGWWGGGEWLHTMILNKNLNSDKDHAFNCSQYCKSLKSFKIYETTVPRAMHILTSLIKPVAEFLIPPMTDMWRFARIPSRQFHVQS